MIGLEQMGSSAVEPLYKLWLGLLDIVPGIVAALVVLLIGYFVAAAIGIIVRKALEKVKFEKWMLKRTKIKAWLGGFKINRFIGLITKWYVFVMFFAPAADLVRLRPLASLLLKLSLWIPNIIVAVLVAFFGVVAADYVCAKIRETKAKGAKAVGEAAKVVIIVFVAFVVLEQIGLQIAVARNSFLIILAGLMLAISLGVGLAFGLGLKGEAAALYKKVKKKL